MSLFTQLRKHLRSWFGRAAQESSTTVFSIIDDSEPPTSVTPHKPGLVAYDINLLERSRTQWQFGDWESLLKLDRETLEHHPDRAKLALLAAAGHMQRRDIQLGRQFTRLAQDWGCSKKLVSQILIAGVHNTLGRAAAITGEQLRMEHHFRNSVAGSDSQIERTCLIRCQVELHCLGLNQARPGDDKTAPLSHEAKDQSVAIYPQHGITSYAQNFEDVMLWRALWDKENGFYIDIGAWDPVVDSVSKAFYEQGWRGVHVEPLPEYAEMIRQDRPDEKVYQVLIGAEAGEKIFYYIPETGLSTALNEYAEKHRLEGYTIEERKYPVITLAQLFDETGDREIDWLKIDVEGMEDDVLAGWGGNPTRPWIILLESTEPNSTTSTWIQWQHRLEERGYRFVYFDGLNRFYIHAKKENLAARFKAPPNVFDKFKDYRT